jgi:hypothetical protein
LYAGAIAGSKYGGFRDDPHGFVERAGGTPPTHAQHVPEISESTYYWEIESTSGCGCLVDTLEQIQGFRPEGRMGVVKEQTFALAMYIPLGATPETHEWAKAAADGIEDYLASGKFRKWSWE